MRIGIVIVLIACLAGCGLTGCSGVAPSYERRERSLSSGSLAAGPAGPYLEDQARELEAIAGAEVQRRDDALLVSFSDEILFQTGNAELQPQAYDLLRALARTLNSYPQSHVIVKGHTDSVGGERLNQRLSEDRADRVRSFLIAESVQPARLTAIGFGESMPVATNDTQVGRAQNRRVEVEIRPDAEVLEGG